MVGKRSAPGAVTYPGANGISSAEGLVGPPPSTLAAQLVRDHAADNGRAAVAQPSAEFKQMLNEILHNDVNPETDPEINYHAICLVVELGLDVLATDDDPFAKDAELLSQACDSIAVIEITISRHPDLLFYSKHDDQAAPMVVWLFARLLKAATHQNYRELQPHVSAFFTSIVAILSLSLDYWQYGKAIACLYQEAVDDIVNRLQEQCRLTVKTSQSLDITLPPARSIARLRPGSGLTMAILSSAQITLHSLRDTFDVALTVVDAFGRLCFARDGQQNVAGWTWTQQTLAALSRSMKFNQDLFSSDFEAVSTKGASLVEVLHNISSSHAGQSSGHPELHDAIDTDNGPADTTLSDLLSELASLEFSYAAQPKISQRTYTSISEHGQEQLWMTLIMLSSSSSTSPQSMKRIGAILNSLLEQPTLTDSIRCTVLAARAVQSYAQSSGTSDHLDLSSSAMGRWCVRGLTHTSREFRSNSARALITFLREGIPPATRDKNRREALATFRKLSNRVDPGQHETLVQIWGQVAIVCGDRERNLALLQLVEYLGHANSLISGLAACELEQIADNLNMNPEALMRPYWKSIAVAVVKDLISIPQKASLLAQFLSRAIDEFLLVTEAETVPYLVLTKRKDVLQRIVNARNAAMSMSKSHAAGRDGQVAKRRERQVAIQDIIHRPLANLAGVLALLLRQSPDGMGLEEYVTAVLTECVPHWTTQDIASLIRSEPLAVVAEMLKAASDEEDPGKKPNIYKAIQDYAVIHERFKTPRGRPAKLLADFFVTNSMGITLQLSRAIERHDDRALVQEKVRCLKAIEEMINLGTAHVEVAVPQIRACLQAAIDQGGLIDQVMSVWLALVSTLAGENVVPLLGHLFSIIVQQWSTMSSDTQQRTYDTVAHLLKTHSDAIRDEVINIPSLADIPLMAKFQAELSRLKSGERIPKLLLSFVARLQDENASIVLQAGRELLVWLEQNQNYIHDGAVSEPPMQLVVTLTRALLKACVKYNNSSTVIADICARCLGFIGCLDPTRVDEDAVTEPHMLLLSNFEQFKEICSWVATLFTDVLVPAFKAATNARAQGFLAWAMQELLKRVRFEDADGARLRSSQTSTSGEVWLKMPESTRNVLLPFLTSNYSMTGNVTVEQAVYPILPHTGKHSLWLRKWVYDMLWRGKGDNPAIVFPILARVIMWQNISLARFLLPYLATNIVLGGTVKEVEQIGQEMLLVLSIEAGTAGDDEVLRQCSEDVFAILDYMTRWAQEKKRALNLSRIALQKAGHSLNEAEEESTLGQIASLETLINSIPADIIAKRAIECGSYTRALFHWENFIREQQSRQQLDASTKDGLYLRLQAIYSEIDEPDGLDGISAQMNILTPEQQAWQHLQAGRWTAAQSWYEIELMKDPSDRDTQSNLLLCLQQSGQASHVVRVAQDLSELPSSDKTWQRRLMSFRSEAAWSIGALKNHAKALKQLPFPEAADFNVSLAQILIDVDDGAIEQSSAKVTSLRSAITRTISSSTADSLPACHQALLQMHVLHELEEIQRLRLFSADSVVDTAKMSASLDKRLAVLGTSVPDKQFVLGVRRAVLMATQCPVDAEVGKLWLCTARLARKANIDNAAHFAVICASKCGDAASKIEQARLMWKNGQHRQAIHSLQGAIDSDIFAAYDQRVASNNVAESTIDNPSKQNMLAARAHLLLAKWLDASGQTQAVAVTEKYQYAAKNYARWEKGHYYLGKHYNKLLEAEKLLPANKQSESFHCGEITKLVIENYLRSVPFGSKYWYQTIPKLITLWLDLGMDCLNKPKDLSQDIFDRRNKYLAHTHSQLKKYYGRVPQYVFYTALPQLISRISHPNIKVAEVLSLIITGIVSSHPQQGLWALLPVARARAPDRANRGRDIISKLRDSKSKPKSDSGGYEVRHLVMQGQKLQEALLNACEVHLEGRSSSASLSRDLGFNHKLAPNPLVIPFQNNLTPNIPTVQDSGYIRTFKAFASDRVTIASFHDEVLVLNSLQRPRKLTLRGSDGKSYGILCKPKDDLRKDQRLMEFNTMINRALKRSPESSRRRLYIKTYGVTPLSEESGTIEWVEGIKPLRDILLRLYSRKGITPNYTELRALLNDASSHPDKFPLFTRKILPTFPAVLHEWFTELFPSPSSWFASRLRYTRTAAVMSMVGHVLGLGDRHGENILLEEGTGGVFHVDFNCLFDKGLTFEKPELVPFRLTHNMVDAMGPVLGVEGPFRYSAELTLRLLREEHDTLMNILETFLHDPTTDFVGRRKRTGAVAGAVPETPREVLDSVSGKLRGYLRGETVPLSVEGMVQALIDMARDEGNLCRMYIGWCAFL